MNNMIRNSLAVLLVVIGTATSAAVAAGANGENPAAKAPEAKKQVLGYQLDVSRCKVPKQEVIYRIVDILASLGYNHFQLYTEHTFAYKGHETVWKGFREQFEDEYRRLWLLQNRPGGLEESLDWQFCR